MIRSLLSSALAYRWATLLVAFLVILGGGWAWLTLRKEAYPDVGDTAVQVITTFPGRAAEEVEQRVTVPIERALNGVPRVITRRSRTIFGLSVIQLTFEDGVDDYWARARVLEKLNDAVLPDGVSPSLGPLSGPVGEIFRYVIEAPPTYTPMELRTLQDWTVVPKLLQVPGIADVVNFGGLVKQYHVVTTPDRLAAVGLTIGQVGDAITANNVTTGGNVVERGGQGFIVRALGAIKTSADIGNIVVTVQNGVPVFVRDVADVQEYPSQPSGVLGYSIRTSDTSRIDVSSGVQGLLAMRRGENASEVVEALKARVALINATALPPGVRLRITYDRSELVTYTIHTVGKTLFEGFSLVIIVLLFFLGSLRAGLVVASVIPVAMLFAFLMMRTVGIDANLLSLGAVDFGIIVDGAVVMVENIMRRYALATPEERGEGIVRFTMTAAQEVGREIYFSISVIILAYLPIFTLQRVEGKLFAPMGYTLGFAITGSMLLALTVIPVLMTFLYRRYFEGLDTRPLEWHNPVFAWMRETYARMIDVLTARPWRTVGVSVGIVVLVVTVGVLRIGTEFLPELDEGAFNIRLFFPVGMSLTESSRYQDEVRRIIASHRQVHVVLTQLGRNDDGTDPYGPNRDEILVGLNDYTTWRGDTTKSELLDRLRKELEAAIPGSQVSFSQPILDNVTEAVTGSVADLAVLINGDSLPLMRQQAESLLAVVKTVRGATEYGIEQEGNQAQLTIEIDRAAAARFGVNVSDVQKIVEGAIGARPVSTLFDGSRRFDIVVRYSADERGSVEAIRRLPVTAPGGQRIPLSQLARVELRDGPTIIYRQDGTRQVSVRTNIRERDQGSFVAEARAKVAARGPLPTGMTVQWGGGYENLSRAARRLAIVLPLTFAIIFLVLFLLYRDVNHVIVALSCIPFAMVGGILAMMARGYPFNVSAGVGFVSLFGISTMSGVLFVSRANHLREAGRTVFDAVHEAAVVQLRPRLMTIVLALLGLIPAARHVGIGSDVQRPLATVIVGGLASSLVLTLLVLPSLYLLLERRHEDEQLPPITTTFPIAI